MGLFKKSKTKEQEKLEDACYTLIEDILDNYGKYSDEDKQSLKNKLNDLKAFNETVLDKYDTDKKIEEHISKFVDAFNRFFGYSK